MPQEMDGSWLTSLIWTGVVYWWIFRSLKHMLVELRENADKQSIEGKSGGTNPLSDNIAAPPFPEGASRNLRAVVQAILRRDGAVTLDDFLAGALATYETVVAAFHSGDRETLRSLVSAEVYGAFVDAIAAREARKESTEIVFSRIARPEILDGLVDETRMRVSIRFAGESFRLVRSAAGEILGGPPKECRTVDIWTFERSLSSRENAWRVVATEAGE